MKQNNERVSNTGCVLTLKDFICLFVLVLRENEEKYFYVDPLRDLILNAKREGKYKKLLENICIDDNFSDKLNDVFEKLDGSVIKRENNKKIIGNGEDTYMIYDNILSRFVKYIDNMFEFTDEYYTILDNDCSYLDIDKNEINNKVKVRIL